MRVVEKLTAGQAICDDRGRPVTIDLSLVGDVAPGTWIMTFLGAAREIMDEESARRCLDAITALEAIMSGRDFDVEAAFPDLVGREPQLPPHLRGPEHLEGKESLQ